jgi:hypothetical protein
MLYTHPSLSSYTFIHDTLFTLSLNLQRSLNGRTRTPCIASSLADLSRGAIMREYGVSVTAGEGVCVVGTHLDLKLCRWLVS